MLPASESDAGSVGYVLTSNLYPRSATQSKKTIQAAYNTMLAISNGALRRGGEGGSAGGRSASFGRSEGRAGAGRVLSERGERCAFDMDLDFGFAMMPVAVHAGLVMRYERCNASSKSNTPSKSSRRSVFDFLMLPMEIKL